MFICRYAGVYPGNVGIVEIPIQPYAGGACPDEKLGGRGGVTLFLEGRPLHPVIHHEKPENLQKKRAMEDHCF